MLLLINDFEKINILEYAFREGGGGHQKAYAVYAFINVDNCERPLTQTLVECWRMYQWVVVCTGYSPLGSRVRIAASLRCQCQFKPCLSHKQLGIRIYLLNFCIPWMRTLQSYLRQAGYWEGFLYYSYNLALSRCGGH